MADQAQNESTERARKLMEQDREVRERAAQQYAERMKGKPTPTQEENDLIVCGALLVEKEDDGSGPDLVMEMVPREREQRHVEAGRGRPAQQYQTRQSTPQAAPHRPSSS